MKFEWDRDKAESNRRRHGVGFREATTLFTSGAPYLEKYDEAHSGEEDRFSAIGVAARGLVHVTFTQPDDDVIRLVSARRATRSERRRYEAFLRGRHA